MGTGTERSLKSLNVKWLVSMALADAVAIFLFIVPEITKDMWTTVAVIRGLGTVVLPVLVLLIVNVLPYNVKAMLVYWKPLGWLPGSEAFTKYGPVDERIDMIALKRNVGVQPIDRREQNSKWYKLYKMVENQTEVAAAQKDFLLYRDMAVISLPLIALVPLGLWLADVDLGALLFAAALFAAQYLLTAVSARHSGIRFVTNVLAIHSAKKIAPQKAAAS
jgi:hypothetical protein